MLHLKLFENVTVWRHTAPRSGIHSGKMKSAHCSREAWQKLQWRTEISFSRLGMCIICLSFFFFLSPALHEIIRNRATPLHCFCLTWPETWERRQAAESVCSCPVLENTGFSRRTEGDSEPFPFPSPLRAVQRHQMGRENRSAISA